MVDFTFKRSVFHIREMVFAPCADAFRKNCDVVYLHSNDKDLSNAGIKRLSEFIVARRNDRASVSDVSELFAQCTPQHVANQIIQACKKGEEE